MTAGLALNCPGETATTDDSDDADGTGVLTKGNKGNKEGPFRDLPGSQG